MNISFSESILACPEARLSVCESTLNTAENDIKMFLFAMQNLIFLMFLKTTNWGEQFGCWGKGSVGLISNQNSKVDISKYSWCSLHRYITLI